MRSTFAIIHLDNLKHNFENIRKKVTPSKVLAVVKADAYGHGVIQTVAALEDLIYPPDYYGVALTEEGIDVRSINKTKPILVFEPLSINNINEIISNSFEATVFSDSHLSLIKKTIIDKPLSVHIKIDTGMGRLGIHFTKAVEFVKKAVQNNNLILKGIYTHFATSDEKDKSFARLQLKRFNAILAELKSQNINPGIIHAANSGAILDLPESYFDMVRPGISLYGYYPSLETSESIELKPAMSLLSEIDSIQLREKGESVSYGRKWIAKVPSFIASLPIGYADGLNRNLTNSFEVLIKGEKYSQVGGVTMDRIMVNIKERKFKVGEKVVLLGKDRGEVIDAWHWCKVLKTIPYEITCSISKRVPRIYR